MIRRDCEIIESQVYKDMGKESRKVSDDNVTATKAVIFVVSSGENIVSDVQARISY